MKMEKVLSLEACVPYLHWAKGKFAWAIEKFTSIYDFSSMLSLFASWATFEVFSAVTRWRKNP